MNGVRALAAAGALLFVAGGLVGWFRDLELDRAIPAHHFVSVGAWAWGLAVPALLAALAPFERRWLRWLWLSAPPLVLVVALAGTAAPGTTTPFPFYERADEKHLGLALSLGGSLIALLALLEAFSRAPLREGPVAWRRPAVVLLGVAALAAAVSLGLRDRSREAVEDRIEAEMRRDLAACNRPDGEPVPDIRVRCEAAGDGWRCAQQVVHANGRVDEGQSSGPASATAAGC